MDSYVWLKSIHILTAVITTFMFASRFLLSVCGSGYPHQGWMKRVPPMNDTVLLVTAIALLVVSGWQIGQHLWITLKVIGVAIYIGFGWFALCRTLQLHYRLSAFCLAIATLSTVIWLALQKPL